MLAAITRLAERLANPEPLTRAELEPLPNRELRTMCRKRGFKYGEEGLRRYASLPYDPRILRQYMSVCWVKKGYAGMISPS